MVHDPERGESLVEVVVATAIASLVLAALLNGTIIATHRFGPDLTRAQLDAYLQQEMHVCVDLLKYQDGRVVPQTIATTLPMPSGSPIPMHVSLATSALSGGAVALTLTATSDLDASESVTLQTIVGAPAPLPSSTVPQKGDSAPN
jgi:hypothetical protein